MIDFVINLFNVETYYLILQMKNYTYQPLRDWEGKIKKITQKEYTASVGHVQFYPPEGALAFQDVEHRDSVLHWRCKAQETLPLGDVGYNVQS